MIVRAQEFRQADNRPSVTVRCPGCRIVVTLSRLDRIAPARSGQVVKDYRVRIRDDGDHWFVAERMYCPTCRTFMFVLVDEANRMIVASFPPQRLDFDPTDVPAQIVSTMEEAITCHTHECYRAASVMVRRALEEICDERGATGRDLRARITDLRSKVTLPPEILDGLTDLRLLGNDATHIELKNFDQVGKDESEAALELVKLLVTALYQYGAVVSRLRALKRSKSDEPAP